MDDLENDLERALKHVNDTAKAQQDELDELRKNAKEEAMEARLDDLMHRIPHDSPPLKEIPAEKHTSATQQMPPYVNGRAPVIDHDSDIPPVLGRQVQGALDGVQTIAWRGAPGMEVVLRCTEFTSHCPVTGQPDFGELEITYVPDERLIETKSLKMWLASFRDKRAFNEVIVDAIAGYLWDAIEPHHMEVKGTFKPRGGIVPVASAIRTRAPKPKQQKDQRGGNAEEPVMLGSAVPGIDFAPQHRTVVSGLHSSVRAVVPSPFIPDGPQPGRKGT